MYYLEKNVNCNALRKYGFKPGYEYLDSKRCFANGYEKGDFWLMPMDPDSPDHVLFETDDLCKPMWSLHVSGFTGLVFIFCDPEYPQLANNMDLEEMFYALYRMISDGIIKDDYAKEDS